MRGLSNISTGAGYSVDRALNTAIDSSFYNNSSYGGKSQRSSTRYSESRGSKGSKNAKRKFNKEDEDESLVDQTYGKDGMMRREFSPRIPEDRR